MATVSIATTYTHVTGTISDLQYNANQYDSFKFNLYIWDGVNSVWNYADGVQLSGSAFSATTSASYTFTYLEPNRYYYVEIYVNYNGIWYPNDPSMSIGFITDFAFTPVIPEANIVFVSATAYSITFSRSSNAGSGSSLKTQIWMGSWVDIDLSGYGYSTSGNNITVSNLNPSTTYYFRVLTIVETWYSVAPYNNGNYYADFFTTAIPIPTIPNAPTLVSRADGSLTLQWNSVEYASYYVVRYKNYNNVYQTVDVYGLSVTLDNLEYGVRYYVSVKAVNTSGSSAYSSENPATTLPSIPTISSSAYTTTTITIQLTDMIGNWDYVTVWYSPNGGGTWYSSNITYGNSSIVLSGLSTGTQYTIKASSFYTLDGSTLESYNYSNILYITPSANVRPSNFIWTTSIASGGNIHSFDNTLRYMYIVTATEWNSFTTRINAFRTYKGLSTTSFTTVSRNTTFTASIYNEARNAIAGLSAYFTNNPTLPPTVSTGTRIYASYFTNLSNALNSIL